jgi:hypothetical protein
MEKISHRLKIKLIYWPEKIIECVVPLTDLTLTSLGERSRTTPMAEVWVRLSSTSSGQAALPNLNFLRIAGFRNKRRERNQQNSHSPPSADPKGQKIIRTKQ